MQKGDKECSTKILLMIKVLYWKIRGVANICSMIRLHKIIQLHCLDFIALSKPMVDYSRLMEVKLQLGFDNVVSNSSSSIWVF